MGGGGRHALVLVVVAVAGEVDVVDPDVRRCLDADGVARGREDLGDLEVAQDHIVLPVDAQADALERWVKSKYKEWGSLTQRESVQDPAAPSTDVFEPTRMTSLPVMVPEMMTILASLPSTAAASSSKEVTVVVEPPEPPVVLHQG